MLSFDRAKILRVIVCRPTDEFFFEFPFRIMEKTLTDVIKIDRFEFPGDSSENTRQDRTQECCYCQYKPKRSKA